ncbi:conserved hypothetical protein [gamma proteobacterium NOR5-3]|nr:conserved hypothetical protein [gamma proteobacterium NOR5-3]
MAKDLSAADLLPAELLRGEHHVVDDRVRNDGYLNYYTIQSDFGEFEAVSNASLRMRIREIEALGELDELSQTDVFINAMGQAGVDKIVSVTKLVADPVAAVKGAPSGIGRLFKSYSQKTKRAVAAVMPDDKDAEQATILTDRYYGVTDSERKWSEKLRVDPYTSNEVLRDAVQSVALVDAVGSVGVSLAAGVLVPFVSYVGYAGQVSDAIWGEDPFALRARNKAALLEAGADEDLVEKYLDRPWMSPAQQTLVTSAITALESAEGATDILVQALHPEDEVEVRYLVRAVTLLAWYHVNREPFVSISTELAIPGGITANGKSVLLFPSDHVYWTEPMADAAMEYQSVGAAGEGSAHEIWILGTTSDRTAQELLTLEYDLHTDFSKMVIPVSNRPVAEK